MATSTSPASAARNVATPAALAAVLLAASVVPSLAEDTVELSATGGSSGKQTVSGRIVDYTRQEIVVEASGGRQLRLPGDRVRRVQTQTTQEESDGDGAFAKADFAGAIERYRAAQARETRPWVQQRIAAQIVRCRQSLGQIREAGDDFAALIGRFPQTPWFDCIPLSWIAAEPAPALEQAAQGWMAERESPAVVLMGASHSLSTRHRATAIAALKSLALGDDPWVASLAVAQSWRAQGVTATAEQIEAWSATIEKMPERLRPGPLYTQGAAWARQRQWERSSLAMLRVALLHPEHRLLAAHSLLSAGQSLEQLGRPEQAARLYRELLDAYAETAPVREARQRLEELSATVAPAAKR